jgi:sugar phosphate permease
LAGVVYAVVLAALLRDHTVPKETTAAEKTAAPDGNVSVLSALRALFGQPSFLALVAYFSLFALANWGINGWLPTYLKERFNLGQGKAGLSATGYIQIASFVGVLIGGVWSDRWIRANPRGRLYVPVIGFCVGGPFLFLMASTDAFLIAIVGMIVYGLGRWFSDTSTMPILCQVVDRRYRATGYGFLNLFSTFVGGVMIYAGGVIRDANMSLSTVFQASAAGLVVAGLVLLLARPARSGES